MEEGGSGPPGPCRPPKPICGAGKAGARLRGGRKEGKEPLGLLPRCLENSCPRVPEARGGLGGDFGSP